MQQNKERLTLMNYKSRSNKIAIAAVFTAMALIFSYIEAIIPFAPALPGVKLGIANIVIVVALYHMGARYAFSINILRVIVSGLLFTGLFGALYSLAGALLSFAFMVMTKKTKLFSVIGVSIAGGFAHNLGQILVAAFLVSNIKMFVYFPILIISGVISGMMIGFLAYIVLQKINPYFHL